MPHRVLCIEEDDAFRQRVKALLEEEGFAVDLTESGLEGIARALTLTPDLVLADVHLPDIEGYDLAARLKREKALAKVPFLAVGDSPEEHDVALAAGADGFISRRLEDSLRDEVRAFLAGKRERLPEEGERAGLRALSGSMAARLETALTGQQRASRRIEELDRLRSAFMHNLAHELSTPLTPLAGYLRIFASGKLGALPAQQQRIVESMIQSVTRLTRVVDNLADFASLEVGEAPLIHGDVEPDRLADDVVQELRAPVREARLHVEPRLPHRRPQLLHDVVGEAVRLDVTVDERRLAHLEAREVGQVVHDAGEPRHRLDHRLHDPLLLRRQGAELPRRQDAEVARERRERGRELVREVVHERAAQPVELLDAPRGALLAGERRLEPRRHGA